MSNEKQTTEATQPDAAIDTARLLVASGEPQWVFVLADRSDGDILGVYLSEESANEDCDDDNLYVSMCKVQE